MSAERRGQLASLLGGQQLELSRLSDRLGGVASLTGLTDEATFLLGRANVSRNEVMGARVRVGEVRDGVEEVEREIGEIRSNLQSAESALQEAEQKCQSLQQQSVMSGCEPSPLPLYSSPGDQAAGSLPQPGRGRPLQRFLLHPGEREDCGEHRLPHFPPGGRPLRHRTSEPAGPGLPMLAPVNIPHPTLSPSPPPPPPPSPPRSTLPCGCPLMQTAMLSPTSLCSLPPDNSWGAWPSSRTLTSTSGPRLSTRHRACFSMLAQSGSQTRTMERSPIPQRYSTCLVSAVLPS